MKMVLDAAKADFSNVPFLTIYMTDIAGQYIMNEISARHFDPANPPGRTLLQVMTLAHISMLIEIDAVATVGKGS
jgi:enamine deaminase RidA (YjgF/YER057c/UK114 family)